MDNDMSRDLKRSGEADLARLRTLDGAEFDKAYVDMVVKAHTKVLEHIDQHLMPGAKAAEVKELVTNTRPVVASHLDQAKRLQNTLATTPSGTGTH
jgi:putative membrane protein